MSGTGFSEHSGSLVYIQKKYKYFTIKQMYPHIKKKSISSLLLTCGFFVWFSPNKYTNAKKKVCTNKAGDGFLKMVQASTIDCAISTCNDRSLFYLAWTDVAYMVQIEILISEFSMVVRACVCVRTHFGLRINIIIIINVSLAQPLTSTTRPIQPQAIFGTPPTPTHECTQLTTPTPSHTTSFNPQAQARAFNHTSLRRSVELPETHDHQAWPGQAGR